MRDLDPEMQAQRPHKRWRLLLVATLGTVLVAVALGYRSWWLARPVGGEFRRMVDAGERRQPQGAVQHGSG